MPASDLGEAVRAARNAKGYSLRKLQDASGVECSYIAYLEQGRFTHPNPLKLHRLAQALQMPTADLYALAGYLEPAMLPELVPYLKLKYGLPEPAAQLVADYVHRLQREHGATP